MNVSVVREVAALGRMTTKGLRARYAEVLGEATAANNKTWLVPRIAWRLQALAEGDLSDRARARATELARDADLRVVPPKPRAEPFLCGNPVRRDSRPARGLRIHSRPTLGTARKRRGPGRQRT